MAAKAKANESKSRELSNKFGLAMREDRKEEALGFLDQMIDADPQIALPAAPTKFKLLMEVKSSDAAYAFAKKITDGPAKDDGQALNAMAWMILDDEDIKTRDYDYALAVAKRADEVTDHKNAAIIDTLARAYFEKGDVDKAVELQTKALASLTKAEEGQFKEEMEANLAKYKAAKK
jgi:tetratricopeptide (TPR) repeat protein